MGRNEEPEALSIQIFKLLEILGATSNGTCSDLTAKTNQIHSCFFVLYAIVVLAYLILPRDE